MTICGVTYRGQLDPQSSEDYVSESLFNELQQSGPRSIISLHFPHNLNGHLAVSLSDKKEDHCNAFHLGQRSYQHCRAVAFRCIHGELNLPDRGEDRLRFLERALGFDHFEVCHSVSS